MGTPFQSVSVVETDMILGGMECKMTQQLGFAGVDKLGWGSTGRSGSCFPGKSMGTVKGHEFLQVILPMCRLQTFPKAIQRIDVLFPFVG